MKFMEFLVPATGLENSNNNLAEEGAGNELAAHQSGPKGAASGERGEARWRAGASMGWFVGNWQPNGASGGGDRRRGGDKKGRIWYWDHRALARDLEFGPRTVPSRYCALSPSMRSLDIVGDSKTGRWVFRVKAANEVMGEKQALSRIVSRMKDPCDEHMDLVTEGLVCTRTFSTRRRYPILSAP